LDHRLHHVVSLDDVDDDDDDDLMMKDSKKLMKLMEMEDQNWKIEVVYN
jgi:hypothetical protein